MLNTVALGVVTLVGLYLIALAAMSLAMPARASGFLMGFASSATAHYAELLVRVVAGFAFIAQAPSAPFPRGFAVFGWLLVGTTAALFLVPWRWHQAFARRAVPQALRYLPLVAIASLLLGAAVIWSMSSARASSTSRRSRAVPTP